jgi:hypothetical protein
VLAQSSKLPNVQQMSRAVSFQSPANLLADLEASRGEDGEELLPRTGG